MSAYSGDNEKQAADGGNGRQHEEAYLVAGDVLVRRADGEDLTGVIDIGRRTWPQTYEPVAGPEYVEMGLAKWWTQEANIPAIRAGRVNVAEIDGALAGMSCVGMDTDRLRMWKLYVLPEYQGRGAGGALMRTALSRAAGDGHPAMWLSYLEGNTKAADFYHHYGFTEVETEHSGSGIPDSIVARRGLTTQDCLEESR